MCLADARLFLPGLNLSYTDRASMAASVEVRVPFVDPVVAQAAFAIPGRDKIRNRQGKLALKRAAEQWLPHEIVYRPKASFSAPLRAWVRNDLRDVINDMLVHGELTGVRDDPAGRAGPPDRRRTGGPRGQRQADLAAAVHGAVVPQRAVHGRGGLTDKDTMKQIAQNYKSGELTVLDAPVPACRPGGVLVQSLFSLISTGTEMMKVHEASLSMVGKARARPDQVRKVLDTVAQQGAMATYKKVMNKLDSYTPLGYSLCGVVVEVGAGAEEFKVGQLVAAAGNEFALHAEYNWVPVNLCAAVPRGVAPEHAAFSTVGAIAMQGVRRAEPQLGETSLVIGLGLVGQLVVRLLVAAGVRVVGLDMIEARCRLAEQAGAVLCAAPDDEGLAAVAASLDELTSGRGADHVFLAAGGSSNAPGRDRGQAGPGPGPGGRHRQDQARPALERLLREGTRRPVLPVLRPGPLRRPVRARGHRLPGGIRPLDRAPQPGVLPGPAGPQGPRGRDARSPARSRWTTRSRSTPTCPPAR